MINDLNQRIGVKHCQKILFQHFYTKMLKHVLKPTFLSLWKSKRNTISFCSFFDCAKQVLNPTINSTTESQGSILFCCFYTFLHLFVFIYVTFYFGNMTFDQGYGVSPKNIFRQTFGCCPHQFLVKIYNNVTLGHTWSGLYLNLG